MDEDYPTHGLRIKEQSECFCLSKVGQMLSNPMFTASLTKYVREAFLVLSMQKARLGDRAGREKELSSVPITSESLHDHEQILDHLDYLVTPNHIY